MKNILFVHPALEYRGGGETILINYLNIASKIENMSVDLFLLENRVNYGIDRIPSSIHIDYALTDIEADLVHNYFIRQNNLNPDEKHFKTRLRDKTNQKIAEKINAKKYDIIIDFHNNVSRFEDFLIRYDINNTIPVVKWIHGIHHITNEFNRPCNREYYKIVLNKYKTFVTISDDMKTVMDNSLASFDLVNKNTIRLYNPLDLALIRQQATIIEPQYQSLLAQDFIVAVGRLDAGKNYQQLLDIYHQLQQKGIKEKLYIIGDGYEKENLLDKIKQLGLEDSCSLLGRVENPYPFMNKAKLFVHTSLSEGFGLVLAESMTCGTPVVAFDCPTGPREILADGKYGGLIPMGDNDKFVDSVYTLLTDESKRQAYIDVLPESVERFGLETIKQQFIHLIEGKI